MGKVNFVFGVNWGSVKLLYFSHCHDCVMRFGLAEEGGSFMLVIFWVWGEPVLGLPLINGF